MKATAKPIYIRRMVLFSLIACLVVMVGAGCSSTRKQRESRKKREALVDKNGLYCDLVKVDPDLEMEIELNIKMASVCEPGGQHSITYYPLDSEIRGILFCCMHKKPEMPPALPESEPTPSPTPVLEKKAHAVPTSKKR